MERYSWNVVLFLCKYNEQNRTGFINLLLSVLHRRCE